MRMRPSWLIVALAACTGLAACTIQKANDDDTEPGEGGSGGEAGAAAGGSAGTTAQGGGAGATNHGACGDVPVSGICADKSTIKTCVIPETSDPEKDPEKVITTSCGADRECVMDKGVATCKLLGECQTGDTSCKNDTTLLTCAGSGASAKWQETACNTANGEKCVIGKPGTPAKCFPLANSGQPDRLTGTIQFERRKPNETNTGWTDVEVRDATDAYVGVFDGDVMIGKALTGYDIDTQQFNYDGRFTAELSAPITDNTWIWVWAMAFNYDTGQPLMAIAKAKGSDVMDNAQSAEEYWAWGAKVSDLGSGLDLSPMVIREADGSGAMNAYQWIDFGLQRTQTIPGTAQKSLIVYWSDQFLPECGACFCGPQCGGGAVKYGTGAGEVDMYDSFIALGGPEGDQTHWASPVVSHEFGHYVMMNYSVSPGEGGPHYLGQASKPGLAYSEAWATAFAQTNVGAPVYMDQQEGTFFWVNIAKYTYTNGNLEKPDPDGPIDQYLNENVAAGMIWKLWVPTQTPSDQLDIGTDPDGRGLGDSKIFTVLTNPKLIDGTLNRGYSKVDLVDFFDSALCTNQATEADISAVVATSGFPYDPATKPACQ